MKNNRNLELVDSCPAGYFIMMRLPCHNMHIIRLVAAAVRELFTSLQNTWSFDVKIWFISNLTQFTAT